MVIDGVAQDVLVGEDSPSEIRPRLVVKVVREEGEDCGRADGNVSVYQVVAKLHLVVFLEHLL